MVAEPSVTAVVIPLDDPIEAMAVLLLLQTPPLVVIVSAVVAPGQ